MILKIFSVYDCKVGAYMTPIFARSTGEAIRSFTEAANDSGSQFCKYAEDFTLFEVGAWSDDKCAFVLKETPVSLGKAIEFIRKEVDPSQMRLIKEAS